MITTEYYRQLPHWQHIGATFFVTFNLRGAIPHDVYERLQEEKELAFSRIEKSGSNTDQLYKEHIRHFARVDHILDTCQHGPNWLAHAEVADLVKTKLHEFDNIHYELLAYCIMPNHVHIVVDMAIQLDLLNPSEAIHAENYTQLFLVLKRIKGGSARVANLFLNRTGAFWQPEYYDHYVRDSAELNRIINYVLQNPVKAGLTENWQDWPHTYLSPRYHGL
ncbi:transposase [Spirosoma validum]|uniref:Transposase n=1 Tax=Spirosoma validum TaxID=2771355 RepID=A0A927GC63_9BACT|nr:transposase [Spirosoma validum]MBD2752126.1 transposase [Spirosoma validum]